MHIKARQRILDAQENGTVVASDMDILRSQIAVTIDDALSSLDFTTDEIKTITQFKNKLTVLL